MLFSPLWRVNNWAREAFVLSPYLDEWQSALHLAEKYGWNNTTLLSSYKNKKVTKIEVLDEDYMTSSIIKFYSKLTHWS